MTSDGSVTQWIADLEFDHADEAQEALWRRYFGRLIGLARLKLGETPRAAADEEDVATAALHSFFAGAAQGRFPRLHDRHDLWPLLAKITSRKALDQQRWLLAKKRGGGRVRGDSAMASRYDSQIKWPVGFKEQALPSEFLLELNDECGRLIGLLADEQLKIIALRRLEGYTNAEIATELGIIERTVERRLNLIRSIWTQELSNR